MAITPLQADQVLREARKLIGKSYADFDCSHFVCEAFKNAGLEYPYTETATFAEKRAGTAGPFEWIPASNPQAADVLLFIKHMGLWDPMGCVALGTNPECKRLQNQAPFLSSRSGNNRGPDYGLPKWWGAYRIFRWKGFAPVSIILLKKGQVVQPTRAILPTRISNWKYFRECAGVGGGLTVAAKLTIVEISTTPGQAWIRVQIPGSQPPRYLKIAGDEYSANFILLE